MVLFHGYCQKNDCALFSLLKSPWKQLSTQSLYRERNLSLHSNLTHSTELCSHLVALWCSWMVRSILLCSDSLLCASEPLWGSVGVYLCACEHISWNIERHTHSHTCAETYNVNYSPCHFGCNNKGKWSSYILPGSDISDIIWAESISSHIQKCTAFRF